MLSSGTEYAILIRSTRPPSSNSFHSSLSISLHSGCSTTVLAPEPNHSSCRSYESAHFWLSSSHLAPPMHWHLSWSSLINPNTSKLKAGFKSLRSASPRLLAISLLVSDLQPSSLPTPNHHHGPPLYRISILSPSSGAGMQLLIAVYEPATGIALTWPPATPYSGIRKKHVGTALKT